MESGGRRGLWTEWSQTVGRKWVEPQRHGWGQDSGGRGEVAREGWRWARSCRAGGRVLAEERSSSCTTREAGGRVHGEGVGLMAADQVTGVTGPL